MMRSKVSIVRARTYDPKEVSAAVRRAVDLLGGMSDYVKKGEKILLKPNVLSAKPPESGVDTHPEVLRAVAGLVKEAGAEIVVGDSPGGFYFKESDSTYEAAGIKRVCEEEGLRLAPFDRACNVNGIPLACVAKEVDGIISIPKMKTHNLTTITGAVKNSYGMAVGLYKAQCHFKAPRPKEFAEYIVNVFECAVPRLVIMDGVVAMEGGGPAAGGLREAGLILAGNDCVACDAVFAALIGLSPLDIETTQEAHKRKLGEADLSRIEVLGEDIREAKLRNFKLPETSVFIRIPKPILKLLAGRIKFRPKIDDGICEKCRICAKSCPAGCITVEEEGSDIDYKKCVNCFCCLELCPYKAISIERSLLARLLGG
jgi:uncharacterized protein (DUF362 family)/Pyruvate/2-oxoacid:ferredoxin oxidoreductase delta subunit